MNGTRKTAYPRSQLLLMAGLLLGCSNEAAEDKAASPTLFDAPAESATGLAPVLAIPEDAPVVAFLGDSIPAGLHLAEHQAFPSVLQARLIEQGLPFKLINASESGRTTAGGASAVDWVLRSKPDVLVITLGGNDGLRGIELETIEANLRSMIEAGQQAGARILLLGIRLPLNYGDYGTAFDALYPKLASEFEVQFVPFYMNGVGGVADMNLADGLHPTALGHEHLAGNVLPKLRELLEQ